MTRYKVDVTQCIRRSTTVCVEAPDEEAASAAAQDAAFEYPDDVWYWKYDSPEVEETSETAEDCEPDIIVSEDGEIIEYLDIPGPEQRRSTIGLTRCPDGTAR